MDVVFDLGNALARQPHALLSELDQEVLLAPPLRLPELPENGTSESVIAHGTKVMGLSVPVKTSVQKIRSSATCPLDELGSKGWWRVVEISCPFPTLRRWGKKMFVAVDDGFFEWMPEIETVDHISNADICWKVFTLEKQGLRYRLRVARSVMTTLEESRVGLVGGTPTPQPEFEQRVRENLESGKVVWRAEPAAG